MRKLTLEELTTRFRAAHGEDYDYFQCDQGIAAHCRHCSQEFIVSPARHARGQDRCGCEPTKRKHIVDLPIAKETKYLNKFKELYGDSYTYVRCFEVNGVKRFVFIDLVGDLFEVEARKHALGRDPSGTCTLSKA